MKICMIVPHFFPHVGGGEQLYYDIARGLIEQGNEVIIVTSASGGIEGKGNYEDITVYGYKWKMFSSHPIVKYADLVEHVKWCDIVHTTMFTPAINALKCAHKYNKPCVITIHEVIGSKWFWFESNPILALAYRIYEYLICTRKFDAYHVVSNATRNDYIKYCGKKDNLYVVYNSIHLPDMNDVLSRQLTIREEFGVGENDKIFLYYGRPAPNKGFFVLEKAIEILKKREKIPDNVKFCFLLAANPVDKRAAFVEKIKRDALEETVIVRESLPRLDLFKMILEADYVIVPSITEGFGFAAVEACSLQKCIIHSDGGSLPEVVFGKCLSFKNRDAEDLAAKIESVIENGTGVFTEIPVKSFDKEIMVKGILELYDKIYNMR